MVSPVEEIVVELQARVDQFDRRFRESSTKFDRSMRDIEQSADRGERKVKSSFDRMANSSTALSSILRRAAVTAGAFFGGREIVQILDSAKKIESQLKLATQETGSFARAMGDVRSIATSTRTSLEETANLYATFQRNARELGITQEESARATETVTKAFRISGATAAEATGGLRQFLQGVQSGTLRGEELNSVLENAPRLARLLADSLGVTIGELRALGQEGELTGDKLINALTSQEFTAAIDEEFKALPVTFGEAVEQINTAATITFGAFDRGGEFSKAIVNFITDGADGFAEMERAAASLGSSTRAEIDGIVAAFGPLIDATREWAGLLGVFQGGSGKIFNFENDVRIIDQLFGTSLTDRFVQARDASLQSRAPAAASGPLGALSRAGSARTATPPAARVGGGGGSGSGAAAAARREQAEASRLERERVRAIRERLSFEREVEGFERDIADARAAFLVANEDLLRVALDRIEQSRSSVDREIAADQEIGRLTAEQAEELQRLNNERAGLASEVERRRSAERQFRIDEANLSRGEEFADAQRGLQQEILQGQADLVDTQAERRDIERRLIDLQYAEERARNDYLIGYYDRLRVQEGITESELAEAEAQARIAELRNESLEERRDNSIAASDRGTASPFAAYLDTIPDTAGEINEALESVAAGGLQSMVDGLTDAIVNFRSLGDVGRSVLQSLTASLVRMALQQIILKAIGQSAGNAAVAATGAQAATAASAWAPAAALASLATLGSNAGPASIALATTSTLAQALAATSSVARADGGPIGGPGGPRDDNILMRASAGEYVIKARSAARLGRGTLDYLNRTGDLPNAFADGGFIGRQFMPMNEPARASGGGGGPAELSEGSVRRLAQVVGEAANAMPPVNLYPTLDPAAAMRSMLASPGGKRAMFDFFTENSGKMNGALGGG